MIINEERSCAGLLADGPAGRTQLAFDDIGCMLDYQAQHPESTVVAAYVHDCDSRQWIDASCAWYITSSRVATPMGSGIAAATSAETLVRRLSVSADAVCGYDRTREARSQWRKARNVSEVP
jgi:hypothetical protein